MRLGSPDGDGPGGVFVLDGETFDVRGRWEMDRGPQYLAYDFAWHLGHDSMITSEWGTPNMFEDGLNPELLLGGKYGHQIHVWDLQKRMHKQVLDLGAEQQLVFELRPARNPTKAYGFAGVVVSLKDLSSSIWLWYKDGRGENAEWKIRKVIEIPAEPADPEQLPPMLKGFGAVPPFITDINLSLDDRYLYVSCWGSGEFRQYDVSDPFQPKLNSKVAIGGMVRRAAHPSNPGSAPERRSADGGAEPRRPARVRDQFAVRRGGRAVLSGWHQGLDDEGGHGSDTGEMRVDPQEFFPHFDGMRPHQTRLEGGDASSDSYCYS